MLFIETRGTPGVFNVLNGMGEIAGKVLALHNDVVRITFTGSISRSGRLGYPTFSKHE